LHRNDLQTGGEASAWRRPVLIEREGFWIITSFPRSENVACATSPHSPFKRTSRNSQRAQQTKCCRTSRETRSVMCFLAHCGSLCSTIFWSGIQRNPCAYLLTSAAKSATNPTSHLSSSTCSLN